MNILHVIAFLAEIWGVMFLIWGAFHEDRLVAFEQKVGAWFRKAVRR